MTQQDQIKNQQPAISTTVTADGINPVIIPLGIGSVYEINMRNVTSTVDQDNLTINFSQNYGMTFDTSDSYAWGVVEYDTTGNGYSTGSGGSTSPYSLVGGNIAASILSPSFGTLVIYDPSNSTSYKTFRSEFLGGSSGNNPEFGLWFGVYAANTNPINAIQITGASGPLSTGIFTLVQVY